MLPGLIAGFLVLVLIFISIWLVHNHRKYEVCPLCGTQGVIKRTATLFPSRMQCPRCRHLW